MKEFATIEKNIGISFKNKELLKQAFVHRSYLNENKNFEVNHNERLEFLGDAVLELVVTSYLYENYPDKTEGELTNFRSALVKGETISEIATGLGFNDFLYLSRGESQSTGRARQLILANCFEAVTGAIYLDQGYEKTKEFILKYLVIPKLPEILDYELHRDPKSVFQELVQEKESVTPLYRLISEDGPDHDKIFTMGAYVKDRMIGKGTGPSKQLAEISAAEDALKKYLPRRQTGKK